jgi:hypothetical protein
VQIDQDQLFLKAEGDEVQNMDRLARISFIANGQVSHFENVSDRVFWSEDFFHLKKSGLWQSLSNEKKIKILSKMSEHLLREAYYIENAGIVYAAKMNIFSETQDERSFFAIMGYEEAKHLDSLKPFFSENIVKSEIPAFSRHIGKIILDGDRNSNLFLIQILLEGWGLTYYQELADGTTHSELKNTFFNILKDESRHHSAGVILFRKDESKKNTFIKEAFTELLSMVRVGPWTLINEIKMEMQDLSQKDILKLLSDLGAEHETHTNLMRLQKLTEKNLGQDFAKDFQDRKLWSAYSLEEMAKAHL